MYKYVLTDKGRDLRPVLRTLKDWGQKHTSLGGRALMRARLVITSQRVRPDVAGLTRSHLPSLFVASFFIVSRCKYQSIIGMKEWSHQDVALMYSCTRSTFPSRRWQVMQ